LCVGKSVRGSDACVVPGRRRVEKHELPLLWFDRVLRAYGPLLPLPVVALRAAATAASPPPRGVLTAPTVAQMLAVYGAITLVRLAVYGLHQV
jgi:hypothetical protein